MPFPLISDRDKTIAKAYNAMGLFGKIAKRKSYIIDPEGKIAYIFDKVNAKMHYEQVLNALTELQK